MKFAGLVASTVALSAASVCASSVQHVKRELQAVTVKGNAFFVGDKRFYVRGIDYQPGGASNVKDPLADSKICKRDIAKFKDLGLNTIRVYSVDNSVNHDECMSALADAGIYLMLDVNTPLYSINRANPRRSYNDVYLQNVFATVDMFSKYDNVLAYFSGNEVINDAGTTQAAPFVKAVTRDIRQYLGTRGYRKIPVGYSAADVSENRKEMADYMNCGTDDERSDFFAFNDYSWCDPSDFKKSGWDQKVKNFTDYGLPLFLSEYGCNTNKRQFGEVASLYSSSMTAVFSGGLVYEYSEEGSDYGVVKINGDDVEELEDYKALKSAFDKQDNPSGDGGYKREGRSSTCPRKSANWEVDDTALPALPANARKYYEQGAGTGVGLGGPGSQEAGEPSSGNAPPGSGAVTTTAAGASPTKKSAGVTIRVPAFFTAPLVGALIMVVLGVSQL
ncbi:MAG: beta-glucanosyltransferase [Watsoniomyces obsoletus]|nr:MAG: beta-glucanosyltransferase [Watsoniomyces obsoletus]